MKTISAHSNINNHGLNQLITAKKSFRKHKYYQNYDQAAGDINRNATISQAEYQRDACEEELYRLRYGIENLLANNEQGDFKVRQRQRFTYEQNPFRTMTNRITDFQNRKYESWIERCSPCCRRGRRNRFDDDANILNEYDYRHVYNDSNYDLPTRRTPRSPVQSQLYSDTYVSTSPSPRYIDPNMMHHTKNDLRQSIDNLIRRNSPNKTDISDLLTSKDMADPIYNSLILKILEAKALDCLCSGYSKQNTQKQISQTLAEINQRVDEHQSDSVSVTSSISIPSSSESSSSSSISSILTEDESISSRSITPQLYSPLNSAIQTPNLVQTTSKIVSPDNNKDKLKSSLKLNEDIEIPKKQPKVTILADETLQSSKLKKQKHSSSKHRKKSTKTTKKPTKSSRTTKKPTKSSGTTKKPSKSKKSTKHGGSSKSTKPTKHRSSSKPKKSTKHGSSSKPRKPTKHRSSSKPKKSTKHGSSPKSKKSTKHGSSSKSKKKKDSSKSPSKSTTHKSKHKKSHKKKSTKPKSNNQVNDREAVILPTFIYPRSYQEVYRNRQRLLKLLLSST